MRPLEMEIIVCLGVQGKKPQFLFVGREDFVGREGGMPSRCCL